MDKNDLFNQVFDMYFDKVYSYFAICFNRNIADDLAQQTFFNVWKYMKRNIFFEPDSWKAWIFRIAVNVKNDFLRNNRNQITTFEYSELQDTELKHPEHDIVDIVSVKHALDKLTLTDKELLLLKNNGLSSNEIGEMLNIPASTVRSRLAAAKKRFKKALHECGVIIDG
ncbi:MAG: RNA polymerase sigma factor [Clostridiales bacterium]|nr:RNA polymerase sigma factor [Clostridiales bacterium]